MSSAVRLLVRADDAGSCHASNAGCLDACLNGIARSVEVMMPCAWIAHAAEIFNERPQIDIGIHLTLSSEWDRINWRPLTAARSLVDASGNLLPLLSSRSGDERRALQDVDWRLDEVAAEFRAQIELGVRTFRSASHVSAHMVRHFTDFDPRLGEIIGDLCEEFGLKDDAFGHGLPRIQGYPPTPRLTENRVAAFCENLSELNSGTYIFIDHPAIQSDELAMLGHQGYEDVDRDRWTCLETLKSPLVRETVERLGIDLISYRDL
ncbi:ChbG/HpnK family deacetylase [uncultured Roseibium sp.]|uniref:ChbG/HpnK family deacetylase n=1 Tax=uncultured Roseibium sp. TaxID=1936171 RepID=UPI00262F2781|nr:ChbG/HpnK family deacetylase [uncultured Roseibium sp.]